jgi:iron complex outermembrane receptor protein
MKKLFHLKPLVFLMFLGMSNLIFGQNVSGIVTDDTSQPIPGVSVVIKGTTTGTSTDFDGNYTLKANNGDTLVFSYVGYEAQEIVVTDNSLDVILQSGVALDAVVLLGNRARSRTILDSPVPIDNISVAELTGGGQPTIEAMLTFKVPSFNAQNQAISDASAHYDPADLRGLGPSRTLVLINGKRRHSTSLVNVNSTVGRGSVGFSPPRAGRGAGFGHRYRRHSSGLGL